MAKDLPSIGELEIQVLQCFWDSQPCTERQVWEAISSDREVGRTTVLKTIQRLESKGLLKRLASKSPVQFKTTVKRHRVLPTLVKRFVDTVLGGASDPIVAYLANANDLSSDDIKTLTELAARSRANHGEKGSTNE
ncbi:MAG: BlaI/MecI/CopY family transcriptional regulator [Planctomycetales bacterium]|nr:BlaI/MecI/CopY family transcriptional regulator [Planctomycetales bacterium]